MPACSRPFGKRVVVSGEYIWKYTHNAFDFSVLGNTPITFPIDWHNSKIPGYALHAIFPFHNFSAYFVASSVAARFFPPQVAGAGAPWARPGLPFRIDHDENSTRPPTCNINSASVVPGPEVIGATTRARWRAPCLSPSTPPRLWT
jgi:hypothetical protein